MVEQRFAGVNGGGLKVSNLQMCPSLDKLASFIEEFFAMYFLTIAQRSGQKPVPFIPISDASFEVWFGKVYLR